jgi:hypothetical protein
VKSATLHSVAYGNSRFVVTGSGLDWPMTVTSINGLDWGLDHDFRDIVAGPDRLVTVGASGSARITSDGRTWTPGRIGPYTFNGVAYGADKYRAIGNHSFNSWIVYSSTDGLVWTAPVVVDATTLVSSICYGDGLWVVVGYYGSYIATSPDGITWTQRSAPEIYYQSVTHGESGFVAVGEGGQAAYSVDGITWEKGSSSHTHYLWNVKYLNGRYWAVGNSGTISYSETGASWTLATLPTPSRVSSLDFGFGKYIAVDTAGRAFSSVDGVNWREEFTGTTRSFRRVAAIADSIIAFSTQGTVLRQSRFGGWLADHFPTLETQKDIHLVGATADPDGDGVTNLMEYAFGTDPTESETEPSSGFWLEAGRLNYQYRQARADIDYIVETSASLLSPEWTSDAVDQGDRETEGVVTASVPADNSSTFLRLKVTIK